MSDVWSSFYCYLYSTAEAKAAAEAFVFIDLRSLRGLQQKQAQFCSKPRELLGCEDLPEAQGATITFKLEGNTHKSRGATYKALCCCGEMLHCFTKLQNQPRDGVNFGGDHLRLRADCISPKTCGTPAEFPGQTLHVETEPPEPREAFADISSVFVFKS